ncbi:MAG: membrane dipeptidase [Clostridia bacterium]|nr:membrane dipeptidase [Clostridia bacterium]
MRFFDLHCDTAYKMYREKQGFYKNNLAISGQKGEAFDGWRQTFAVWLPEDLKNPFNFYKNTLSYLKANLCGNVKPIYAVEGGTVLENDVDRIYALKQDGIRLLTLTWNGENAIAGGTKSDKGLTDFGKTVIDKMNKINMAVDVSHLNDKSFFEVIDRAEKPLASHSNCRKICDHPRNLSDSQIKLICQKGGLIGLNFYPIFLGDNPMEKIYQNIYHLCAMGYENNIAIGSDFDGADMANELCDITKISDLHTFLQQKGLKNSLLNKIFYKNAHITFDKWDLL